MWSQQRSDGYQDTDTEDILGVMSQRWNPERPQARYCRRAHLLYPEGPCALSSPEEGEAEKPPREPHKECENPRVAGGTGENKIAIQIKRGA